MHRKPMPPVKPQGSGKFSYKVKNPKFKVTKTDSGTTREYEHANGKIYREYTSHATVFGMPTVSIVRGHNPETGKMGIARGFIAIGQRAVGVIALGQFVNGYVGIGQLATGRLFALGQCAVAPVAIGQASIAVLGLGQLFIGGVGIGQIGLASWGIFQMATTVFGGYGQMIIQLFP